MAKIAVVVLSQDSVATARQLMTALPEAVLYGLAKRTTGVDVSFEHFKTTVQELFSQDIAIVGLCAAGILIRSIAPLLQDKLHEPAVIAVASDGSAVVPLLGGLHGANDLARQIATALKVPPAITTTGDIRFQTTLLAPPAGYKLANPQHGKQFISDLIAGQKLRLLGRAAWLEAAQLPIDPQGKLSIQVTEQSVLLTADCLIYHPSTIVIAICRIKDNTAFLSTTLAEILAQQQLSIGSIAGIITNEDCVGDEHIRSIAHAYQVPLRFITSQQSAGELSQMIAAPLVRENQQGYEIAISIAPQPIDITTIGQGLGKLSIVGTGPGSAEWMSPQVKAVLQEATDWVGYSTYLNLVEPLRRGQNRHDSDNRVELERSRLALNLAAEGRTVAVVSSGDPGIYAMAAAVLEAVDRDRNPRWQRVEIQICPGISAMQAAASLVGAPLGHDFCAISLSDILKPWSAIEQRLIAAAQGDFVIAFYNPISSQRTWQLEQAKKILLQWRKPETPIVLASNISRPGQSVIIKNLGDLTSTDADMRTMIVVGSSKTRLIQQLHQKAWLYTPRHYEMVSAATDEIPQK
jgi:cobalt-precorrin 5A hydrolase / precorrin-3B C17-methyltransferase